MRPHPYFTGWAIPAEYFLGAIKLKALSVDDLDRDYEAVMQSAADIKTANPTLTWPDGLTREQAMVDLAWHQKEFESRRSFAWVVEDKDQTYLGCIYVYPSIAGEKSADVAWWWKTGAKLDRKKFRHDLYLWLSGGSWPPLDYHLQIE